MEGRDGMNDEAAQRKLRALIDTARGSGRIVNPVEIASHAREAGLDVSESLSAVRNLRTPTHPVGHSDNIRSGVPDIRSPRDVATERAFLMSPLFDAVKLFEVRDRGAARGAVRAPRRWRGVARGGGPVARHVSFFRSEGPSKGNL